MPVLYPGDPPQPLFARWSFPPRRLSKQVEGMRAHRQRWSTPNDGRKTPSTERTLRMLKPRRQSTRLAFLVAGVVLLHSELGEPTAARAQTPSSITVNPSSVTFLYTRGAALPAPRSITATVPGGGRWSTFDQSLFYDASPACAFGTCPSGSSTTLTPLPGMTALAVGTYQAPLTVRASGFSDVVIPVTVIVSAAAPPPSITVNPSSVTFLYTRGAALPASQSITATVPGGGRWSTSSQASFYSASPCAFRTCSSGSSTTLTPTPGMTALAVGTYQAPLDGKGEWVRRRGHPGHRDRLGGRTSSTAAALSIDHGQSVQRDVPLHERRRPPGFAIDHCDGARRRELVHVRWGLVLRCESPVPSRDVSLGFVDDAHAGAGDDSARRGDLPSAPHGQGEWVRGRRGSGDRDRVRAIRPARRRSRRCTSPPSGMMVTPEPWHSRSRRLREHAAPSGP